MTTVLNNEVIYAEEPLPLSSTRRVAEFENNRGNIRGGGTAYISIPNLRNGVIDCNDAFVKFTVQSTLEGTNLPHIDATPAEALYNQLTLSSSGAISFIRKIDIFSNSALVASIDHANKLASIISVSNNGLNSQNAKSAVDGTSLSPTGDLIGNVVADCYGVFGTASTATKCITPEMTFIINNGILACLGEGMMPIFAQKNGIELQIQFETDARLSYVGRYGPGGTGSAPTTISSGTSTFTNISYVAPIIEFDNSSMDAIIAKNGFGSRDVMWSGVGYHANTQQLTITNQNSTGLVSTLLANNRFKSLKSLHVGAFDNPSVGDGRGDLNVPRIPFTSIQYRMNGLEYPINRIDTIGKVVQNTISCHSNNSPSVGSTLMKINETALNYRQSATVAAEATSQKRGVCGLSLETWAETDSISGLDVSQSDTEALINMTSQADATAALTIVFVSTYDVIYVINDQGVLSASYN